MSTCVTSSGIGATSPMRVRSFSRLLSLGCLLAIVGLPVLVVGQWALKDAASLFWTTLPRPMGTDVVVPAGIETWQRAAGAFLTLIPVAFTVAALVQARRCFRLFAAGIYFDTRAVIALRGFAGLTALSVAAGFIVQAPLSLVLTCLNPVGQRSITLALGNEQIGTLFFAGLVWVIAAVMASAVSLAEENAKFV
jgi:hypothetical protein